MFIKPLKTLHEFLKTSDETIAKSNRYLKKFDECHYQFNEVLQHIAKSSMEIIELLQTFNAMIVTTYYSNIMITEISRSDTIPVSYF